MKAQTLRIILRLSHEKAPSNKTCRDQEKFFLGLANELRESGQSSEAEAAALLAGICSMIFNDARTGNPWGPFFTDYKAGRRSLEADDLDNEHLDALGELVPEIDDPELRARIADVLWTRGHGYQFGQMAIAAYSDDGDRPEASNHASERISRLGRAANIARRLGRTKPLHISALDRLDQLLDELTGGPEKAPLLPNLLDIIFDHQLGEPEKYLAICETVAGEASIRKEWDLAARFWDLASSWHHRLGREDEARRCRQSAAREAIARGRDPDGRKRHGAAYSAGWILRGLTALKSSGGARAEIEALSSELAKLQGEAQADFHTFGMNPKDSIGEYEDEHSKHVERLECHLSGKMLPDAIFQYCSITEPTNVADLKSTIMEGGAGFLTQMIGMVATDSEGKETDKSEGIGWNGEVAESDLLKRLYEHARTISWPMACDWFLDPGRRIIVKEHAPRIKDLVFLVSNNPFVPLGHERIFLRGIHAGFEGDFLLATHLLVPQLEGSLRRYLKQRGLVTWVLKEGLQKEVDLGGLLALARTKELLGEDLVFDLRGILTEKFGVNLRNDMAHGNMAEAEFFRSFGPLYFWWLILRMVWIGYEAGMAEDPEVKPGP